VTRGFLLKGSFKPTKNIETFLLEEFSFAKLKTRDPLWIDGTQKNFGVGRQKDFRSLTEVKTIWTLSDTSALTFKAPFRWDRLQFVEEMPFFNTQSKYDYRNFHAGPQISYRSALSDFATISLVSEVTYDRLNSKSHFNTPDKVNVGLVGKSDFFIGSNLTITPVIRFDHSRDIYTVANPKLGMTYQPTKGLTFKSNISRNFRSPSFDELYFVSHSAWGTIFGNEYLKPERSWDSDIGFELENDYVKLGHSWFISNIENLITWQQKTATESTFVNLDDQRIWGLEASLDSKLPFMNHVYVSQNYTMLKSDLPYRPQHRLNTMVKWEIDIARLYTNHQFTSARKTQSKGRPMLKAFHVFDVGTDVKITKTSTISAKVENIFNRAYENISYFPMPGRTVSLSYSVSL